MRVPVKDSDNAGRSPPVLAVSGHTGEDVEISLSESEISTTSKQAARSDLTADLKKGVPSDPDDEVLAQWPEEPLASCCQHLRPCSHGLKIIGEIQIHDKRCIPHTLWDCLQGFASIFNVR